MVRCVDVQRTGQCVRCVPLNDLRCHITVDAVASVFDAWIIIVRGMLASPRYLLQQTVTYER